MCVCVCVSFQSLPLIPLRTPSGKSTQSDLTRGHLLARKCPSFITSLKCVCFHTGETNNSLPAQESFLSPSLKALDKYSWEEIILTVRSDTSFLKNFLALRSTFPPSPLLRCWINPDPGEINFSWPNRLYSRHLPGEVTSPCFFSKSPMSSDGVTPPEVPEGSHYPISYEQSGLSVWLFQSNTQMM